MIKLTLEKPENQTDLDKYHKAYIAGTQGHPFLRNLRVRNDQVILDVKPFSGYILLSQIIALDIGQRQASAALDWVVDLAREHDVVIKGDVVRIGKSGMTKKDLTQWYKRHGFDVKGDQMVFDPRIEKALAAKSAIVTMEKTTARLGPRKAAPP